MDKLGETLINVIARIKNIDNILMLIYIYILGNFKN